MLLANRSLQAKLILAVAATMLPLLLLTLVVVSQRTRAEVIAGAENEVRARLTEVERLLVVTDEIVSQRVRSAMALLQERGKAVGPARLGSIVKVGEKQVPNLIFGKEVQANRFGLVDGVTEISGGTATLFVRAGTDFVRVSTNVMSNDKRAVGTVLNPDGKAIKAILAGESFYGQVDILGAPYLTGYAPIFDENGGVIGIWYVGYEADLQSLEAAITSSGILADGVLMLIDNHGRVRMHTSDVNPSLIAKLAESKAEGWQAAERKFTPWGYRILAAYPDAEVSGMVRSRVVVIVAAGLAIFLILAAIVFTILRLFVTRPLNEAKAIAGEIAEGNLDNKITARGGDEIGLLMQSLERMQGKLKANIDETKRNLNETLRIRMALDGVGTGVIISDSHRRIIYTNASAKAMLGQAEDAIRLRQAGFSLSTLDRCSIDDFLCDASGSPCLKGDVKQNLTHDVQLGGRHFTVTTSAVISDHGEALGLATEWLDRTDEVNAQAQVRAVVTAAAKGDFSFKIDSKDKSGFFAELAAGLNELTGVTERGLDDIGRVLGAVSRKDMTARVTAEYQGKFSELKTYCNQTSENLGQMIGEIRTAAATIATAAREIAQGNTDLSSRTEEQAASLEQTASSMEELTSTVKQNADNAKHASALSNQAASVAGEGGELVKQVVTTMEDISASSQKIADIIGVIDGIAFQTNILALNAAVEAARAGDQGRGFAVVASEVRSLAQRSANAAKDIKGLISDSVNKIHSGDVLVKQAGETMAEIVKSIKRVSDINAEITAASDEQASGIGNVSTAVGQMDEMTQQNAALVEQAAAAAGSQQEQVAELNALIGQFKIEQDGHRQFQKHPARGAKASPRSVARALPNTAKPAAVDDEWEEF